MTLASSVELFGNVLTFRARPSDGSPALISTCRTAPGAGAPPNRHPDDEEAFSILSGTYEFEIDGHIRNVSAGEFVMIPRGAPHSFRNPGPQIAEMIIVNWPGRQHEEMFSTLGRPVPLGSDPESPMGPPPADKLSELKSAAAKCGVELLV